MPDRGYIEGGEHGLNIPVKYPGYILRTDSLGDTLWTHTYWYDTSQWAGVNNIIPLSDGRIVVGAYTSHWAFDDLNGYEDSEPWFMLLDSIGNIIRDTVYSHGYDGEGFLYKDSLGGYIHLGQIDTYETIFPGDYENINFYVAHLDTSFRMDWITKFPFDSYYGGRYGWKAIQLRDGNFLVEGDAGDTGYVNFSVFAWAAKIDRGGNILWQQYYLSDSSHDAYFRDVTELPNGNLVFVGATFNDTVPAWHQQQDVWIVGTDSNGCVLPGGCNPLTGDGVKPITPKGGFSLYPNPTSADFTVNTPQAGDLEVYNIQGQQVATYKITQTETTLQLPGGIAAGVYFVKYISGGGNNAPVVLRLIKE